RFIARSSACSLRLSDERETAPNSTCVASAAVNSLIRSRLPIGISSVSELGYSELAECMLNNFVVGVPIGAPRPSHDPQQLRPAPTLRYEIEVLANEHAMLRMPLSLCSYLFFACVVKIIVANRRTRLAARYSNDVTHRTTSSVRR